MIMRSHFKSFCAVNCKESRKSFQSYLTNLRLTGGSGLALRNPGDISAHLWGGHIRKDAHKLLPLCFVHIWTNLCEIKASRKLLRNCWGTEAVLISSMSLIPCVYGGMHAVWQREKRQRKRNIDFCYKVIFNGRGPSQEKITVKMRCFCFPMILPWCHKPLLPVEVRS